MNPTVGKSHRDTQWGEGRGGGERCGNKQTTPYDAGDTTRRAVKSRELLARRAAVRLPAPAKANPSRRSIITNQRKKAR